MSKSIKDFAIDYVKAGKSIFPVGKNKKPLLGTWDEYQTRLPTLEEVEKWWSDFPEANIALVTGKLSGITVVDCDICTEGDKCEKCPKEKRGSDYTQFPETVTIQTGSGGYQLYYKYFEIGNKTDILPHVDIRGDGGYVVAYPSVTNDSFKEDGTFHKKGGSYKIVKGDGQTKFAEFPSFMFGEQKATKNWSSVLMGVGQGSRNQNASEMIGKMLRPFKIEEWNDVWELARAWNSQNTPPLSEYELRAVFTSICKREAGNRKNEIQPEDDVEVLPLYEVAQQSKIITASIETGIKTLDEILRGGIQEGDVTVVSGATGQGKTYLCQSITYEMAKRKIPTLWFSYEVMLGELWRKFEEMGVDKDFISYSPLKMVSGNLDWIEKKIIESKNKYGTKVVFLDHLGFLAKSLTNPNDRSLTSNYALYLSSLCRDIKKIAIANEVSIFLLVHRTKDRDKNDDTSDIAYSAGIAQEADTVMMIRRERLDSRDEDDIYTPFAFLSVTKNRKTGIAKKICMQVQNGRLTETVYVSPANKKVNKLVLQLNEKEND